LAALVLATILAVGFATSMRTERQASVSMANNQNAELIARAAVDHATALLSKNIPQPLPPGVSPTPSNWSVAPGCLFVWNAATSSYTTVPLSSGDSTNTADPDLNQVDANGNPAITLPTPSPTATPVIRAAWVNVLADPSQPANGSAALLNGTKNQIIGRYAFWMDDENSKINITTAYGRPDSSSLYFDNIIAGENSYIYGMPSYNIPLGSNPRQPDSTNPYSVGHPSSVGLDTALFTTTGTVKRDSLWNDRVVNSPYRDFATAGEISNYVTGDTSFYQKNKFWLTHTNGDPEFNAFGKSRIFFTDSTFQPDSSEAGPHLTYPGSDGFSYVPEPSQTNGNIRDPAEPLTFHVDANPFTATGLQDTPTQNSAVAAVQQIASYLNMKWPGYSHSFVEKWSTDHLNADTQGKREAQQVAWNLWGMAANATSGSATMSGTPPSSAMMNGIWANLIKTNGLTQPGWANYLWNGPRLDNSWPTSRILPEVRAARIPRFAISFIATQRNRTNGGTVPSAIGNHYVVNVRLWPKRHCRKDSKAYWTERMLGTLDSNKKKSTSLISKQRLMIKAERLQTVVWSSEAASAPANCLYWDSTGRPNLYRFPGRTIALTPDSFNYAFKSPQTEWDFSTVDSTNRSAPSVTISRSISIPVFTRPVAAPPTPCLITNAKLRFVVAAGTGSNEAPTQISPMRDIDGATGYEFSHTQDTTVTDSGSITISGPISIPTGNLAATAPDYWVAVETLDPRVNTRGTPYTGPTTADDWQLWTATTLPTPVTGSSTTFGLPTQLGDIRRNTRFVYSANHDNTYPQISDPLIPASGDGDESKCAWIDTSCYGQKNPGNPTQQRRMWGSMPGMVNNRIPSIGMISCINTGIQAGIPWRTIKLHPAQDLLLHTPENPPDWLLLDLFAIPYNSMANIGTIPDPVPVPITLMNSTAGKINVNAGIFFNSTAAPITSLRSAPIRGLFLNSYRPNVTTVGSTLVNAATTTALYNNIANYLNAKVGHQYFDYAGEICQVPGISDTGSSEWEREALVRQVGSLITTRSNAFSVWGVAQTVKKHPLNNNPAKLGVYETRSGGAAADDLIAGEKRFRAIIQRYVWPGVDGTIGNGTTSGGSYSAATLGSTAKLGSPTNMIDATDPSVASFYQAYNPGAAVMKYRVVYFEYLN
jgi:hypothetical protein